MNSHVNSSIHLLLLIDDNSESNFALTVLSDQGFKVSLAHEWASSTAPPIPDLVLFDGHPPAIKTLTRVLADLTPTTPRPPLIWLATTAQERDPTLTPDAILPWPCAANNLLRTVAWFTSDTRTALEKNTDPFDLWIHAFNRIAHYEVSATGQVMVWDNDAERVLGWSAEEAVGRLPPHIPANEHATYLRHVQSAADGIGVYHFQSPRHTRDGHVLYASVSFLPAPLRDHGSRSVNVLLTDQTSIHYLHDRASALTSLAHDTPDFIIIFRPDSGAILINRSLAYFASHDNSLKNSEFQFAMIFASAEQQHFRSLIVPAILTQGLYETEVQLRNRFDEQRTVMLQGFRLGGASTPTIALVARDISAIKKMEENLRQINRIYQILQKAHDIFRNVDDEMDLLTQISRLLHQTGGYRFNNINLITDDPDGKTHTIAWTGDDAVTQAELQISTNAQHERGTGPTADAIRQGKMVVRHDIDTNPRYAPWRSLSERWNIKAMVAMPLIYGAQCYGAISIYANQHGAFDAEELRLLQQLCEQVSHAVYTLRAQTTLQQKDQATRLLSGAVESAEEGFMITDAVRINHPIVYVNPALCRLSGWSQEELIGNTGRVLMAGHLQQSGLEHIRHAFRTHSAGQATIRCYRKDGEPIWADVRVAPIVAANGQLSHYVTIISDVTERVRHEDQLLHFSTHDALTHIANRGLFYDRLQQSLMRAERAREHVTVVMIDIDHFKQLKSSYGHDISDFILQSFANRLNTSVANTDTVARLGGDEFALILHQQMPEAVLQTFLDTLRLRLKVPIAIDSEELVVNPSIGVSLYPSHTQDLSELLRFADLALHSAKDAGGNQWRIFSGELCKRSKRNQTLEKELRHALERDEFVLHYQAKMDLFTGELSGFEALVRWQHPKMGLVPPAQFIGVAEEHGLITAIGAWVIAEACRQIRAWQQQFGKVYRVAVNLSAVQLRDRKLLTTIDSALQHYQLTADCLELEVTESMVMENPENAITILRALRDRGIRLAMDDFGTGFSSLGYLRRFPFDIIKIDRSFVQNILIEPGDATIVRTIVAMAHNLGLHVIAEGVETEAQLRYLRDLLCDEAQGYLFNQPMPEQHVMAWANQPRSWQPLLTRSASEHTVLLVDDEPEVINALKRVLRRLGCRLLTADSGTDALTVLAENSVQVLICDQRMPGMDGTELCSRVRVLYPAIKRIILSGYTEFNTLTEAINRGAIYQFITKPWDDEALRELVKRAILVHDEEQQSNKPPSETP